MNVVFFCLFFVSLEQWWPYADGSTEDRVVLTYIPLNCSPIGVFRMQQSQNGSPPSRRGRPAQCASQLHNVELETGTIEFLYKKADAKKIQLLSSHGDITAHTVRKLRNSRPLYICQCCLNKAELDVSGESNTFSVLSEFLRKLEVEEVKETTSERNTDLVSKILYLLAISQSKNLNSVIASEFKQKTHEILKSESSDLAFLTKTDKNVSVLKALLGFAGIPFETSVENLTKKKLQALSVAYQAVLSLKNSAVTTAPAVMNNLMLYKHTHSRDLVDEIGAPSGGKVTTLKAIMNADLPVLMPPSNDFLTTDDNLQVKRVTSSSKLKEAFKHKIKVVNSHVHFQNEKDKSGCVLKNQENQPKHWLRRPDRECVEQFEELLPAYENRARIVRVTLTEIWMEAVVLESGERLDLVGKLTRLRNSRPGEFLVYPCPCGGEVQDVCPICKFDANNLKIGENPYEFCPKGPRNGFDVTVGEIGKFLPAGLENCALLFEHLRKWNIQMADSEQAVAISVNDGRIFIDGSLVQEERLLCVDCGIPCQQDDEISHESHNTELMYGDVYFALGWGHLEARLQSAFIQFGWPVMFEESAKIFGHRTKGALNYFFQCKDFHKTYAFIAAFSEAATKELFRLFVSEETLLAGKEQRPTCHYTEEEFNRWASENLTSPRALWLYYMGYSLGSVFVVMRAAIRNNNVEVAKGALYLLKPLAWSANLPIYRQCILRSGIAEEVQAPDELKEFLSSHKFGQRNPQKGVAQELHCTHQGMDMNHEEIIRLELKCLDQRKLVKNALTGSYERDDEVFEKAARWLEFYGDSRINPKGRSHQRFRKYPNYYKSVLALRKQIRTSGFLVGYNNSEMPFYSSDLKTELHPDLHNFKFNGEENFRMSLKELKEGKNYTELTIRRIPKTREEADKLEKRGEKTKKVMFSELCCLVQESLKLFPGDDYLRDMQDFLDKKSYTSFSTKDKLVNLFAEVDGYVSNLKFQSELEEALGTGEESESDNDGEDDNNETGW